jgi:YidC/Oxa1 family membrane protein insertase
LDKKNTTFGIVLLVAAFFVFMYGQRHSQQPPTPAEVRHEVNKQLASEGAPPAAAGSAVASAAAANAPMAEFATAQAEHAGASVTRIGNSFVEVSFTDFGGSIREVAFKKYPAAQGRPDPFVFNELHADPILAFVGMPGMDRTARYARVSGSDSEITYRAILNGQIEVTRHYVISPDKGAGTDPYLIRCETTLRNLTDKPTGPLSLALSIGTAAPNNALDNGLQLSTEYSNGTDQTRVQRSDLEASSGFFGLKAHDARPEIQGAGPVVWATVKNQFFVSILTPADPASGVETRRVKLLKELPDTDRRAYGIAAIVDFDVKPMAAKSQTTLSGDLYVGPKEYPRLSNLDVFKHDQDRLLDWGNFIFRFCAAILITLMTWTHGWVLNWGAAIILTTLALKFAFLPLTLTASRSAKRMQKIQPEMKAIKEKYKDNAQKQQAATMELFKKHKVNPLGGCIPALITLPFFWAFYRMLQGAAELRFAHFLWARDLSAPDTVYTFVAPYIGTFNVNIFPILLGLTVVFSMRLTPQPTVDNAQLKMMKFMPLMFMVFCYTYSCALSIYSTVNGLFTIGQQLAINRMKDAPDAPAPAARLAKPSPTRKR